MLHDVENDPEGNKQSLVKMQKRELLKRFPQLGKKKEEEEEGKEKMKEKEEKKEEEERKGGRG